MLLQLHFTNKLQLQFPAPVAPWRTRATSFYMIVGLVTNDDGNIVLNGEDITFLPMHEIIYTSNFFTLLINYKIFNGNPSSAPV